MKRILTLPYLTLPYLALIVVSFTGCRQDIAPTTAPTQWLFVMQATDAKLTQNATGFDLVLNGTDPKTIQFADRPVRKANIISTNTFMTKWSTGDIFKSSQPNGAVVFEDQLDANGNADTVAVELINPTGSGTSWTFQLKDLEGKLSTNLKGRVSVFIDDYRGRLGRSVTWYVGTTSLNLIECGDITKTRANRTCGGAGGVGSNWMGTDSSGNIWYCGTDSDPAWDDWFNCGGSSGLSCPAGC